MGKGRADTNRIGQIAAMLESRPAGLGRPISDRPPWDALAGLPAFREVVGRAETLLGVPFPDLTEDLYLDHVRTGGEEVYNDYAREARSRLGDLVLAECVEGEGRFLLAVHDAIERTCAEPTWVHTFHDPHLTNWRGETTEVDIDTARLSHILATTDWLLGERLETAAREQIRREIRHRAFEPFRRMLEGELILINQPRPFTWLEATHNWNAACLSGVVGAALTLIEDRDERAIYIEAVERYIPIFLSGFPADGSCTEGLGYWNGGFGRFLLLAESIWQATRGRIDLMANEHVKLVAQFGARMEILPGVYPAFADCAPRPMPSADLVRFISRRYGLGLADWEATVPDALGVLEVAAFGLPNSADAGPTRASASSPTGLRSWFDEATILVGRPLKPEAGALGVALKGGHNAEHHNHNDVGSFVVAIDGEIPLIDPGSELYTTRTFGPNRYDSDMLNSYGHPVPLVDGTLQSAGAEARGRVLRREFTDDRDIIVLDLSEAYDVAGLEKLEREFVFSRTGRGSLTVTDEVIFSAPSAFGTALITLGEWERLESDALMVRDGKGAVRVDIVSTGGNLDVNATEIEEDVRGDRRPTRIGIDLSRPVTRATIRMTITPV